MQWLLCLTTKVLCEGWKENLLFYGSPIHTKHDINGHNAYKQTSMHFCGRRTMPEYQLIASFLNRVTLTNVKNALKWIQRNI